MPVLRALPSRAWSAVVALVVLASLGVAIVLGAGLDAWRGTVSGPGFDGVRGLSPDRGSGVITLPAPPADPDTDEPSGPSNGGPTLGPVAFDPTAPGNPSVDVPDGPGGPTAPDPGDGSTPDPGTPTDRPGGGHPGTPAVDGPGGFTPLPDVSSPGHGKSGSCGLGKAMRKLAHRLDALAPGHGHLKHRLLADHQCGHASGHAYGHAKHHGHRR